MYKLNKLVVEDFINNPFNTKCKNFLLYSQPNDFTLFGELHSRSINWSSLTHSTQRARPSVSTIYTLAHPVQGQSRTHDPPIICSALTH